MTASHLEKQLAEQREREDQDLLRRLAGCIGAGLRDLQSTRNTATLVASRAVLIQILRQNQGWTNRRCARAMGWPLLRVKRLGNRKWGI